MGTAGTGAQCLPRTGRPQRRSPHEIANACGLTGIGYCRRTSALTLMDIRVQLSSCVPSTHMETAGARLEAADPVPLMDHPRVIGLAELKNFPGVLMQDAGCMAKLEAFQGRHIDGHAPLLRGNDLNRDIAAGIRTEHEATTAAIGISHSPLRLLGFAHHDLKGFQ